MRGMDYETVCRTMAEGKGSSPYAGENQLSRVLGEFE